MSLKVSVIMPMDRPGPDADRSIDSVLRQEVPFDFELLVVSSSAVNLPPDDRVRNIVETNRNPATRRNRAASEARGEILAFIDDDAFAAPDWLATACSYLDDHPEVVALGGPDSAPEDSTTGELISETLLATPWIGSGILAHEAPPGVREIGSASDIALVNLFVRRSAFRSFDESIGYIGEDSALIHELMASGRVVYHGSVRVFHRRRRFPGPYLRQRWRYRVKTGEMLVAGSQAHRTNRRIPLFLTAGTVAILLAPLAVLPYYLVTLALGARTTRLPASWWLFLPFFFALHHLTYYFGICWGLLRGSTLRPSR
ncbi:MAG TPA: glycosyltransferase [Thermoanaerobaculia bacterium]|nr:glycosyltransferase [Thermoanaerobaculia bacterium]